VTIPVEMKATSESWTRRKKLLYLFKVSRDIQHLLQFWLAHAAVRAEDGWDLVKLPTAGGAMRKYGLSF
jgi:hypothetical protein